MPAPRLPSPPARPQGLLTAILCSVRAGDEVIVIEPVYDSYVPAIQLAGGTPVCVQMEVGASGYSVPMAQGGGSGQ